MKNSFGWLLIGLSLTATAAIYQQRDAQGQLIFTDQPSAEAQPILFSTPANNLTIKTTSQPSSAAQPAPTSSNLQFAIAKPYDHQTFHNQRQITVQLTIIPSLATDDRIQLQLDGKPYGAPQPTTQFVLENLERGTHTLQAQLIKLDRPRGMKPRGRPKGERCASPPGETPIASVPAASGGELLRLNKQGGIRQTTPTITIYVHYASLLTPAVNSEKLKSH